MSLALVPHGTSACFQGRASPRGSTEVLLDLAKAKHKASWFDWNLDQIRKYALCLSRSPLYVIRVVADRHDL